MEVNSGNMLLLLTNEQQCGDMFLRYHPPLKLVPNKCTISSDLFDLKTIELLHIYICELFVKTGNQCNDEHIVSFGLVMEFTD